MSIDRIADRDVERVRPILATVGQMWSPSVRRGSTAPQPASSSSAARSRKQRFTTPKRAEARCTLPTCFDQQAPRPRALPAPASPHLR